MGFEALKPAPGGAAEAQKALDKASGANRASALAALALALGAEGKFEDSLTRGLEALDLCEVQKDNKGKGCCFFAVARTHLLRGALAQAQQMSAAALKIFQEAKDGAWEEAAAKLLLAASVGKAGPGSAAAAAGACASAGVSAGACASARARRGAKSAAAALLGAAERRRGSLLRIAEAKGLSSRGDHEAALKRVCDPYTLASGEPDDLTAETPMCPADLGIGLTPEVSAALSRAVEVLAKGGSAKEKAAAAEAKANVLAIQGSVEAVDAAKAAVEASKADAAAQAAALSTLVGVQVQGDARAEAIQTVDELIALSKSLGRPEQVSALCLLASIQGSGAEEAQKAAGEEKLLQAEALCCLAQEQLVHKKLPAEALATSQKVLSIFAALGDGVGQAAAGCMVTTCHAILGQVSESLQAAEAARAACQTTEDKAGEVLARQCHILAALTASRPAEALAAARGLVGLCRHFEDQSAEAWALVELARLHVACDDPIQGVRCAEEALATAKSAPLAAKGAALAGLARLHRCRDRPAPARRAAEKVKELPGRGANALAPGRAGEARALLLAATLGGQAALGLASDAQTLMNGVRDKVGEASANLARAQILAQLRDFASAAEAAQEAATGFKVGSCGVGEGVARCELATIQLLMEDKAEAEKTAKEALRAFHQIRQLSGLKSCSAQLGENRARQLLSHAQLSCLQPSNARLYLDEFNCAHLEISETASQESLESAVATLHNMQRLRNNVKAVVLHLEGAVGPASMHSQALTSGNFLVGLRAISIPIVSAAYGKITGPSWNLLLACDYRIAAVDTSFVLPIVSPPECLGELVGAAMASQLCISSGVLDAHSLQELGILNQVRPNKDETGRAASELAKRIAAFPGIACRQTMSLLTVPPVKYTTVGAYKLPDPDLIA